MPALLRMKSQKISLWWGRGELCSQDTVKAVSSGALSGTGDVGQSAVKVSHRRGPSAAKSSKSSCLLLRHSSFASSPHAAAKKTDTYPQLELHRF